MHRLAFAFAFSLLPTNLWADDIMLNSRVTDVTIYPYGATITRDVTYAMPGGQHRLILADLPRSTPLASVRVALTGATMGSVSTRSDFVLPRDTEDSAAVAAATAEVDRLQDALRDATDAITVIKLEGEAARARVAFLQGLGDGEGVAALDVAALRGLVAMIGEETLTALQASHQAQIRADAAKRDLKDLHEDLKKAETALRALVPEQEMRAMLAVDASAPSAAEGTLTVTYTISDTEWQPVYDLKLSRDTGQLMIERGALVWQGTGENWQDVALTLSTVRPSEQTAPSDIWPWLRRIYNPEDVRVKTVMREEIELGSVAGAMMDEAAIMVEPAPVIEAAAQFDGLAVTYSYPDAVSVASGADSLRLALGTLETSVDLVARAVPLSDQTAFLMARVTNDTGELILPTQEASFFVDGRFIGLRYLDLIPAGGEADLSFGPIDGLRLTRTVLDRNEGDRGVISRSNELTEGVEIKIENLTGETWPVRVLDRVPYSEQEDLEIAWEARPRPTEETVDGKRGVLAWEIDVAPGTTETIRLNHALEWPDGMALQ